MSCSNTALLILHNSDKSFLSFLTKTFSHKATPYILYTLSIRFSFLLLLLLHFHHWCSSCPLNNKALHKVNLSKYDISSPGSTIHFIASTHSLQTKLFARVEVTLLIITYLPCDHLPHFVHITEFVIALLLHLTHGFTLLLSTLPFEPFNITLVFLKFTFSFLLSNAFFHFKNFSFKFS